MSRSRRKTPITGWTTSESDKDWKRLASKRLRRHIREFLDLDLYDEVEDLESEEFTSSFTDPKDGKQYFNKKKHPELMRK